MSFTTSTSTLEAAPAEQTIGVEIHVRALTLRTDAAALDLGASLEDAHVLSSNLSSYMQTSEQ